jgi:hypothetical protein
MELIGLIVFLIVVAFFVLPIGRGHRRWGENP